MTIPVWPVPDVPTARLLVVDVFTMFLDDNSFLPFGPVAGSASGDLSPELRRVGHQLYRQEWTAYREAGCPFGTEDAAMLVWMSFNDRGGRPALTVGKN